MKNDANPEFSMPLFVLTGTYNSKNKGDAAMQISTAQELRKRFPNARIVLHTPFPDLDRPFYPNMEILKSSRRRLIFGTLQILRAALYRRFGILGNDEIRTLHQADAVIDLSGDMMTESYGPHVAYSHFIPLLITLALGRPLMLCAQSIGPFKWTMPLARFIFDRTDLITTRDEISSAYLAKHHLGRTVAETADMAFLLEPVPDERVNEILKLESLSLGGRKMLGVSVSGLIEQHYRRRNPNAASLDFDGLMAGELDSIIDQLDVDILFIPHVTGPTSIKDDRIAAEKVMNKMNRSDRAFSLRGDYRPDELKGVISRLWMHLGARMHASIGAVTTSVPVAAIAYSHKTPGVMKQFGLDPYVVDIAEFGRDDLAKAVCSLAADRSTVTERLRMKLAPLRQKANDNVNLAVNHFSK
ncbi:polysaccharide pyruvyl transferase family protein [Desulfovibrio sp. Fe33]|uniref:polysaccharide pyruvyl transferase family protein n=1 Tax=Desulfovibrio sp. Fe33 TaxID=3020842 RepID=UPI00234CC75A|nr:polysaccharide pyruvyl transferase family protein [Desulfovibrio sp. Fe33]